MKAIELFHQDGKSAGVFYCAQCRNVARSEHLAEQCCKNYTCTTCGKDTESRSWLVCESCRRASKIKKERERFDSAEKLTTWDGWVYLEGTGKEGFHSSLSEFLDEWEGDRDEEKPQYVWACKENHFAVADVSDITERIADNGYEDFDPDGLKGLDDLKAAIEKFNEANKDVVSYEPDYSVAVLLKPTP